MQLQSLLAQLETYGAQLVAVSKKRTPERIMDLYRLGHRDFGENRVQELVPKFEQLPKDIRWHLIGQLQTNKVKYIAPFVHLVHSVDSLHLLEEIHRRGMQYGRVIDCLLQIRIALEDTKSGMQEDELDRLIASGAIQSLDHVRVRGLMGMATHTDDESRIREEFRHLKHLFDRTKADLAPADTHFDILSMGMSDDYLIALEEGSTMLRIGSLLFQ